MNRFFQTIRNIWKIKELREKIIFTLTLLLVYRLGSLVPLPGIDPNSLEALAAQSEENGLLGLINAFSGGAFANASILALGIMPYISASIVVQLAGLAIPSIQKMDKEGESGRRKKTQITRFLTIAIVALQAPAYLSNLSAMGVTYLIPAQSFYFLSMIVIISGTIFAMWLGEKITENGIGNGISLLIMIGIIASLPASFAMEFDSGNSLLTVLIELAGLFIAFMAAIALTQAVRRVPLEYAKRVAGGATQRIGRSYLPLKVNASGVMPIIFAQALMFIPMTVSPESEWVVNIFRIDGLWYNVIFFFMILAFTYFYTAIQINTNQMADDLKRNGGFIPGIKPGHATSMYIDDTLAKITLPGAIFLAVLAILPGILANTGMQMQWAQFYGGTSLLIIVGVVLDTLMQIESYLLNSHYDGLMEGGRLRGRNSMS